MCLFFPNRRKPTFAQKYRDSKAQIPILLPQNVGIVFFSIGVRAPANNILALCESVVYAFLFLSAANPIAMEQSKLLLLAAAAVASLFRLRKS